MLHSCLGLRQTPPGPTPESAGRRQAWPCCTITCLPMDKEQNHFKASWGNLLGVTADDKGHLHTDSLASQFLPKYCLHARLTWEGLSLTGWVTGASPHWTMGGRAQGSGESPQPLRPWAGPVLTPTTLEGNGRGLQGVQWVSGPKEQVPSTYFAHLEGASRRVSRVGDAIPGVLGQGGSGVIRVFLGDRFKGVC